MRAFYSGEVVFAVGDEKRLTVGEALHFIRKLCDSAPTRLWLEGEEVDLSATQKQ
jgi:hypothetical protein